MKKTALLFYTALLLISCDSGKNPSASCFVYPSQIDSLQIRDLYDTARWYLFTWLCDRKEDGHYRGEMDLRYKSFFMRNDSIELFFHYFRPGSPPDADYRSAGISRSSFAFNIKTKEKLWGWDIDGFSSGIHTSDDRFDNSTTPDVMQFIRLNQKELNPCFAELAKKIKVIE